MMMIAISPSPYCKLSAISQIWDGVLLQNTGRHRLILSFQDSIEKSLATIEMGKDNTSEKIVIGACSVGLPNANFTKTLLSI